jgi:hypothetical protein
MHIILNNSYEFCEDQLREGSTFLIGVKQVTFTCIP